MWLCQLKVGHHRLDVTTLYGNDYFTVRLRGEKYTLDNMLLLETSL